MSGLENNLGFLPPQTYAAQLMQSRTQGETTTIDADVSTTTDESLPIEVFSQTYPDLEGATTASPSSEVDEVEVSGYESDKVFEAPGNYTRKLFCWVARSALIPSVQVKLGDHGNRSRLTIDLWYQKPSVTALNAYDQSREIFQESEEVLRVSGSALLETIKETCQETKEAKPDKESVSAIAITCMQLVTYYSHRDNTDSRTALTNAIREYHPDILKDPQFRSTMKRFEKNPEVFKQDFANIPNIAVGIPSRSATKLN